MRPAGLRPIHPAVLNVWLIGIAILFPILAVAGLIVEWSFSARLAGLAIPRGVLAFAQAVLICALSAGYAFLRHRSWGYALRDEDVLIRSGVWWRTLRSVPRSRVQHVDVTSGPLDRAFELAQVSLYTAGGMGPVATIPGLSREAAEQLRAALMSTSGDGV